MTNEKIIDKLQKLKRHAESAEAIGNEEEAQAFAAMFQRLLTDHKLSLTDIEFTAMEEAEPVGQHNIDYGKYPDIKLKRTRVQWVEQLANIVAKAHFCKVLVTPGSSRISLVGRPQDTAVAEYMLITMQRTGTKLADKETAKYRWECYKEDGNCRRAKGFRNSFIQSFIYRLMTRYEQERGTYTESTALIRINQSEQAVDDFLGQKTKNPWTGKERKKFGSSSSLTRRRSTNMEGHRRGEAMAEGINLRGTGIGASREPKGIGS